MIKKIFYSVFCLFLISATPVLANNADLFTYDEEVINAEFAELNELENYIEQNEGITLTQLKLQNIPMVKNISADPYSPFGTDYAFDDPLFGIPGFFWGCFGWLFGVIAVYILTDGNQQETKMSVVGCILTTLVFGGGAWGWGWF